MYSRSFIYCVVTLLALSVSGCNKDKIPFWGGENQVEELPPDFQVDRIWEYPGGDAPKMRLIFEPDGRLIFEGGFLSWNPSQWTLNRKTGELKLIIRRIDDDSLLVQNSYAEQTSGRIRVDRAARTIIFRIDENTDYLNFMNWLFYPVI